MDAREQNRLIYDTSWAEWEDMKEFGPASRWLRWLIRNALESSRLDGIGTILDFGCGTGINTALVAELYPGAQVIGCDISEMGNALANRRWKRNGVSFVVDDGTRALARQYDLVCCFEVLEHVQDWQPLLTSLERSTRFLALSTPTGRMRPFETQVGHVRNFKRGEIENHLLQLGASRRTVFYAGFPFYSPLYREVCQLTKAGISDFARGKYTLPQRLVSQTLYMLFRYLSMRFHGDQLCGVFAAPMPTRLATMPKTQVQTTPVH
jgi:SAM-dependent methyltransferase